MDNGEDVADVFAIPDFWKPSNWLDGPLRSINDENPFFTTPTHGELLSDRRDFPIGAWGSSKELFLTQTCRYPSPVLSQQGCDILRRWVLQIASHPRGHEARGTIAAGNPQS